MESKGKENRFRNHISIIAEQTGGVLLAFAVLLVTQILQNLKEMADTDLSFVTDRGMLIALGAMLLLGLSIVLQAVVWAKTYISLQDNAIIIEKNTLNKKKNTIGIRNISNINLEQNLFEMLIGTCKVKLDTNSRSTADSTDVKIVLKKADAEWFKAEVSRRMEEMEGIRPKEEKNTAESQVQEEEFDIRSDMGDMIQHGIFSINVFSVVILILGVIGTSYTVYETLTQPELMKSFVSAAAGIMVAAAVIFSALWDTVKDFVKYYDFRAKRRGGKIFIKYGFLKKVEYTIPVDKIQALKIKQSLIARVSGRYKAEIVNVGMGDDKQEQSSFLVLYGKEDRVKEYISVLLPEYLPALEQKIQRLPAGVWGAWALPAGIYTVCVAATAAVCGMYMKEYSAFVWTAAAGLILCMLGGMMLKYRTEASGADSRFLKTAAGYFGRQYLIVQCSKIQYAEFKQSFAAKICGVKKGQIHLLASAANATHSIPYFEGNMEERLKRGMVEKI